MARKSKHKEADSDPVAGSIAPGDDAPPVDVQSPADSAEPATGGDDPPESVETPGTDDAPVNTDDMPPVTVSDVDAELPAPVDTSAGLASLEAGPLDVSGSGAAADDASGASASGNASGSGKKARYATRAAKDERNRKEKERREAKARERAGQVAHATGVAAKAAAKAKEAAATPAQVKQDVPGVDLSVLLGLSFHAVSMALPERYGGGALTEAERELLGKAWAAPLAPYLSGAAGPWAVAAISTVQVFALRAMTYQPPEVVPVVHRRPEVTAPVQPAPSAPAAAVEVPAPNKGVTQQEPGVGED